MVRSMWLFKHKFHADGTLSRYKARLVANGNSQQLGADFDETFSPVVKPATISTVLSLVVSHKWLIHQLNVKHAFLNGDLSDTVYMHQPSGFVDARFPNHVCHLQRSLYGLKQAPRAWFQHFAGYATRIIDSLRNEFDMTGLRALTYCIGISADRNSLGLFLSQKKYALQLLERANMVHCYCVFLGDNLLSWSTKRQHILSRSSAEVEYRGVANIVAEIVWLRNLLHELHSPLSTATLIYYDNYVDIFTKGLPSALFEDFQFSLSVHPPLTPTAGAY
ncbi:ribonuclease H-like domain-containing protein [Tanacetum coccineum]